MNLDGRSPLIIVTDAAPLSDDAVALALLIGASRFDIRLIVTTSGNVWAEEAARSVRDLLAQFKRTDIEVCVGTASSAFLNKRARPTSDDGGSPSSRYAGAFARELPTAADGSCVCDDLFDLIVAANKPDLLIIGPASPIAALLRTRPALAGRLGRVFMMGGAIACEGNATPAAEFNFWFDPEAAEAVLASDIALTLLPLDAIRTLHYSREFAAALGPSHPLTDYIKNAAGNTDALTACDEVLAAVMLDANLISSSEAKKLSVETALGPRYGAVTVLADGSERRSVDVITEINAPAFWQLSQRALARTT